ncbi:hypothetical protein DY468_09510 [Rhodopseudomonas sp. BR0M22]|nr:hypothetical protein [Rhodopseudomonas sp. BR0M22]
MEQFCFGQKQDCTFLNGRSLQNLMGEEAWAMRLLILRDARRCRAAQDEDLDPWQGPSRLQSIDEAL